MYNIVFIKILIIQIFHCVGIQFFKFIFSEETSELTSQRNHHHNEEGESRSKDTVLHHQYDYQTHNLYQCKPMHFLGFELKDKKYKEITIFLLYPLETYIGIINRGVQLFYFFCFFF